MGNELIHITAIGEISQNSLEPIIKHMEPNQTNKTSMDRVLMYTSIKMCTMEESRNHLVIHCWTWNLVCEANALWLGLGNAKVI